MITVFIPNNFIPERTYIVHTLLQHYLGIDVEIVPKPGVIHYELTWADKKITIMDQFFGHTIVGQSYLAEDRLPKTIAVAKASGLNEVAVLFGEDQISIAEHAIVSHLDVFAGAFFMLTRWEEAVGHHEDLHGRFPAAQALSVRSGMILRPIVDEYVVLIKTWLQQLGYAVPSETHTYQNVPTSDVDIPSYWLRTPRWKVIAGEWLKDKRFKTIAATRKTIRAVEQHQLRDPYDTFDDMMSSAEHAGLHFQFNMLVGGISKFDGYYSIDQPHIKKLMAEFQGRGHAIGLHPSYNSYHDRRLLREEKQRLDKALNTTITSSRQHYLKFSVPKTWQLLSEEGIRTDSTMGYGAEPGFRCGTCRPFPVFDIHQRTTLSLIERPLLVMDVSLRNYKQLSPEQSMALIDTVHAQVKKHHGEFVWLWHNSNLSEIEGWKEWKGVFEYLMLK